MCCGCTEGDEMSMQRKFIERIRKEEFGIGADLEGDARTIVDNMTRKYRNLLATVAEDLNSKESHFILELIQNADDNHYSPGVAPSLAFWLEKDRLVVVNNETGFTEVNVKALCSAGESSKKNKKGYIGEKGIGFKSIFKVTDTPEIHSNGFHFLFNRTDPNDLLGYVVPHWHQPDFRMAEEATTLVIPAKPGRIFSEEALADVSDTLLLFLGKLRHLEVKNPSRQESYQRHDDGVVTTLITAKSGEEPKRQDYLRNEVEFDTRDVVEPKREGIASTEMVLAFPLSETGEAAPIPGCATYAFLPIRDFGFSFYIQADFVLISSREGIHEDLSWNIRLRDGIADAFAAAVEEFKKNYQLANSFLRYLPTKNEVHDPFFAPVVDQIIDKLKNAECIPVMGSGWKKPAEVLIAPDKIRELFPSSDALTLFGADYPAENFHFPGESKKTLGLKSLLVADVVAIFSAHADWFQSKTVDWKAKFYAYIATSPNKADYVKQLQQVACVPIEGGRMTVPKTDMVFFPLSAKKKYGFEHEISILDGDLLDRAKAVSVEVEQFFAELDVRYDNPLELIQSHVLPLHRGDDWKSADNEALIGHVRYIKDRFATYMQLAVNGGQSEAQAIQALTEGIWIGTKSDGDSWLFAKASDLYLGSEYRPAFNIEELLGDSAPIDHIVTSKYVEQTSNGGDESAQSSYLSQWREFFVRIGINTSPRVVRQISGDITCSDETKKLLESENQSVRRQTLEAFDANWDKYPGSTTYVVRSGRSNQSCWTGLVTALKNTFAPTRKKAKISLDAAYLENEDTKGILGDSVVYVDAVLNNMAFLDACGITHKADAKACLKRLRQIKRDGVGAHEIRKIYRRLDLIWPAEHMVIENAFKAEPLIRVGRGSTATWVLPTETCWHPTNIGFLDARYPYLGGQYKDFSGFFTKLLKVPSELPLDAYVDGLQRLEEAEDRERVDAAMAIYRRLSRAVSNQKKSGGLFQLSWVSEFENYPVYLNHRRDLVDKTAHLYANDLPEYARLFEDEDEVSFLAAAPNELPSIEALLGEVAVPAVSESLTVEVAESVNGTVNEMLSRKLREMVEPIARVVYTQSHDRFEAAINDGLFKLLSNASVVEVNELVQVVTLGEWKRETTGQSAHRGSEIFLDSSALPKIDYIAIEIEKLLRLRKGAGASDAISRLLMTTTNEDVVSYLKVRQTRELPPEELAKLKGFVERTVVLDPVDERDDVVFVDDDGINVDPDVVETAAACDARPPSANGESVVTATAGQPDTIANYGNGLSELIKPETDPSTTPVRVHVPSQPGGRNDGGQTPRRSERSKRKEVTKTGRLLSYLEPKNPKNDRPKDEVEENSRAAEHKRAVELAAVQFFKEAAASQWKSVEEMPPNNTGFDFKAIAADGNEEVIEIKGQGGAWTQQGVALTPPEVLAASNRKDRYWLCVVEFALDESRRRLWLIQNPFGKTDQFRFDLGWKDVAERSEGRPIRPEFGLFVDVPGRGKGKILKVKESQNFVRITVELSDKSTVVPIFNPATMKLSYD